ncbi:MAG: hypothetical protein ACYCVV_10800 [Acidimicrobiales bacterium]
MPLGPKSSAPSGDLRMARNGGQIRRDVREHDRDMMNALEVVTKDCTALTDAELAEMADLSAGSLAPWEAGFLSKQREEWVLVTHAREEDKLRGYAFATLERIGGTPSLLVGLAAFTRTRMATPALEAVMRDLYRRSVLAFPDEDVLVGTRFARPSGYAAFAGLEDIVPRPEHKATGEERAWGRRLAKRFGAESQLEDRIAIIKGDGDLSGLFDFDPTKTPKVAATYEACFELLDRERRDTVVAFGWAMAEALAAGSLPA